MNDSSYGVPSKMSRRTFRSRCSMSTPLIAVAFFSATVGCGGGDSSSSGASSDAQVQADESLISIVCIGGCSTDSGNVGPITVAGNGIAMAFTGLGPRSLLASKGAQSKTTVENAPNIQNWQNVQSLEIKLTTDPSACAHEQAAALFAGASQLRLDLAAGGSGIAAGTFPIGSATTSAGASALASSLDSACQEKIADANRTAATGQVVLSDLTATSVSGSVDLVFPQGEHIKGTFRVPVCAGAQQTQTRPSCQLP